MSSSIPYTVPIEGGIPDTHRPHTERTTTILLPKDSSAFLNPVQEYNRDLSVSVIRAWNEERKERLENAWRERRNKKGRKPEATTAEEDATNADGAGPSEPTFRPPKITILEALSATGLRSIRYAKEIPDVKVVLANDLSASACDAMRRNVQLNGVGEGEAEGEQPDVGRREGCNGVVRVNEGDACTLMYNHRDPKARVDMVDLDPYGTAAPFIDAAIGAINDGGLLAVTCTDLAVLAGSNYPEKCFSNYGGVCCNAEYSHEVALRLVLNSLAQAAARYGRTITPLLSFSIDFYVRLFVRVDTKASDVKKRVHLHVLRDADRAAAREGHREDDRQGPHQHHLQEHQGTHGSAGLRRVRDAAPHRWADVARPYPRPRVCPPRPRQHRGRAGQVRHLAAHERHAYARGAGELVAGLC
jgi:tRNA (guanine26-N2/guanine27-N2)-dimethyltransferase